MPTSPSLGTSYKRYNQFAGNWKTRYLGLLDFYAKQERRGFEQVLCNIYFRCPDFACTLWELLEVRFQDKWGGCHSGFEEQRKYFP